MSARPVEANSLEGKMDAKPTDTKHMDLDLELAVFAPRVVADFIDSIDPKRTFMNCCAL